LADIGELHDVLLHNMKEDPNPDFQSVGLEEA